MANPFLVLWCDPECQTEARDVRQRLRWTRGEHADIVALRSDVIAWCLRFPLSWGALADIVGSLTQEPRESWALAVVSDPSPILLNILPALRGHVVLEEGIAGKGIDLHWDHPLGPELRKMRLGLWSRGQRQRDEPEDPSERLRPMRNVPRSRDDQLEPQRIEVLLPSGKSPADYAAIAYADVPDGSEQYNGVGGRNVLLFHSAMECRHPPFEPHGEDHPDPSRRRVRQARSDAFVFLNALAVGVRHYSTVRVPNNLIEQLLTKKIMVESVIGGPERNVPHRPNVTERQ